MKRGEKSSKILNYCGIKIKEEEMTDWEHRELESKIASLESKIRDLQYDLDRTKEDLESDIHQKADKHHSHNEY